MKALLGALVFLFIYYCSQIVYGENVSPTCENVEVFITPNNHNPPVCKDSYRSWKNTMLNGTFSYSNGSSRKVLIYQGYIGSKINYRFSTCTTSTTTPNYSILINDKSIMKYPYFNPSIYCKSKDACNLGVSKADISDITGLSYVYLKDYSNKMTLRRLTSEELLIQSVHLYICSIPSSVSVVDLGFTSTPSPVAITSNQINRNSSNIVIMKNSGIDTIGDLYLDIKFDTLSISHLNLSLAKAVRVNHLIKTETIISSPYRFTLMANSNSARLVFTSVNLLENQSLKVTIVYHWKIESKLTTFSTSAMTYTVSTTGKFFDPLVSSKVKYSSISLMYTETNNSNSSINNTTNISNSTTTCNNSTTQPYSNVYYSNFNKALSFKVDNSKSFIISAHVASSANCFIQTYFRFDSILNGSIIVSSSFTTQILSIQQNLVSVSSFLIPPSMLNCQIGFLTTLTVKILNHKDSTTNGTITMMKKSKCLAFILFLNHFKDVKSMPIDQSFEIPKPAIKGEANALIISSYSSRDHTPQDVIISSSVLSSQPYYLFIFKGSEMPSTMDFSKALKFTSTTSSYLFTLNLQQIPIGSLLLIVENLCETCSATMSFRVPSLYTNPPSLVLDGVSSRMLSQSPTGSYPYFINYIPSDSWSYIFAYITIQNLNSVTISGNTTYVPPYLRLTATQGSIQRTMSGSSKTVTVYCKESYNTNSVRISTWLRPTSGVWKFNLEMDPSFSNSNTFVSFVLKSISEKQLAFSTTDSIVRNLLFPYFAPPTENVAQRMIVNTRSNEFQIRMVLDSQNLLLSNRNYKVYLGVGFSPTVSKYSLVMNFPSQNNYQVNIISYEGGIIIERGNDRAFIKTPFLSLVDKAIYMLITPSETDINSTQSCNTANLSTQAKITYLMSTTPSKITISSSSYLTKFTVRPGSIIDVDFKNENTEIITGNFLIELLSLQYSSVPTPTIYALRDSALYTISVSRNDYVYKQNLKTMKALKFISELGVVDLKHYSKVMIRFSSDNHFSDAIFRGTAERIDSEKQLYIEKYFFESYITAGSLIGILLLYSLAFIGVFCIQSIRKKRINIVDEKEWENFIPAMIITLPMFFAVRVCNNCKRSKGEREKKYCSVFIVGAVLFVVAVAWLGGLGSIVGITIFETVSLMKNDSVQMILSKSVKTCCVIQSGTYTDAVFTNFVFTYLGNTYSCMKNVTTSNPITDFLVNYSPPKTPVSINSVEGGLSAVGGANLQCKGSKVLYVPEKFELAKYLCIASTFGFFILGVSVWFFVFLCIAYIEAPKNDINAPTNHSKAVLSDKPQNIKKQVNCDASRIPQIPRTLSVHRSPTNASKPTHTFEDYEVFFPLKDSSSPLNKKTNEYEMFDIPIFSSPPPAYTPYHQSLRSTSPYYESPSYIYGGAFSGVQSPVQNGIPPPRYDTIILPPVMQSNEIYCDENLEALTIPPEMTSQ